MISLKNSICISIALLLASCTDRPEKNPANDSANSSDLDVAALVASQMQGGQELASFLDQGEKVQAIDVLDGASQEHTVANPIEEQKKSGEPIAVFSKEANLEPDEFEKIMQVNQPGVPSKLPWMNFVPPMYEKINPSHHSHDSMKN